MNELIVEQDFESLGRVRQPRPAARFESSRRAVGGPLLDAWQPERQLAHALEPHARAPPLAAPLRQLGITATASISISRPGAASACTPTRVVAGGRPWKKRSKCGASFAACSTR